MYSIMTILDVFELMIIADTTRCIAFQQKFKKIILFQLPNSERSHGWGRQFCGFSNFEDYFIFFFGERKF
jgi:hypothetical protein